MKGFDGKVITFEKYVNMFEHMGIAETIYEGFVEHYY